MDAARLALALLIAVLACPTPGQAHPLGNFSISQYTGIRIGRDAIELRYLVDMAEIPTFQEIQEHGIVAEVGHPSLAPYLARKAEVLKAGLRLETDGRRLTLTTERREILFPPGAGGLPTLKLGIVYRAALPAAAGQPSRLAYRDANYPDRAGWKEVIVLARAGATLVSASVPERDRSRELSDYPTDLLNSPPQDREAHAVFDREPPAPAEARTAPPATPDTPGAAVRPGAPAPGPERARAAPAPGPATGAAPAGPSPAASRAPTAVGPGAGEAPAGPALELKPNRQAPRNRFAELIATRDSRPGVLLFALAAAAVLGAFHALEPGHGKTVVAAYLVGSRGTVRHAALLGLTVTASHTAGVYALGGLAIYASRYVVPERLYPWLGAFSGLVIAVLGLVLFARRYAALDGQHGHHHGHTHEPGHVHSHGHDHAGHDHAGHHHPHPESAVSLSSLLALGVTGGIVPCPAAVVVLLSALALNRVGFGLLLIVAFSLGLAAVLVAIGVLTVYAGRLMSRFDAGGPLVHRWLPLASSVVITLVGFAIALQALFGAGLLPIRMG